MTKDTSLFIGEKEIKGIKENLVTYKDDTQETFTKTQLQYIITKEPKDLTQFRDLVFANIVGDMLDLLEKHDVKKWDLDPMWVMLIWSYNEALAQAMGKAFWTYKEGIHSDSFMENIKMSDISRVKSQ